MICAHTPRHRNIAGHGRPRNLFSRESPYILESTSWKICESLLKNQTGRPYSAPYGGPHRVLLPFLAEDPVLLYHRRKYFTSPLGHAIPKIPKSATCPEYQRPSRDAIAIFVLFRPGASESSPQPRHLIEKTEPIAW